MNLKTYGGKDEESPARELLGDHVVKNLFSHSSKGHILLTDNWYTSVSLLEWLYEKGIELAGTIRTNRKGWPASCTMIRGNRGDYLAMDCKKTWNRA
jgi:hypothetical protein